LAAAQLFTVACVGGSIHYKKTIIINQAVLARSRRGLVVDSQDDPNWHGPSKNDLISAWGPPDSSKTKGEETYSIYRQPGVAWGGALVAIVIAVPLAIPVRGYATTFRFVGDDLVGVESEEEGEAHAFCGGPYWRCDAASR